MIVYAGDRKKISMGTMAFSTEIRMSSTKKYAMGKSSATYSLFVRNETAIANKP